MRAYRRLVLVALALTAIVVVFGAYVRLADAGLGCPDWPGCYGQPTPHHAADEILRTHAADPHGPVSMAKAWKEMLHRYLAATLGLLILAIAALAWRLPSTARISRPVATALVGAVIFQGLLGKWTVTLLLKPAIVTAHLIGGLTTFALLAWLAVRARGASPVEVPRGLVWLARSAFVLLAAQIVLGGWTSTNYAALACADFPTCQGSLWPTADYVNAFHVVRELGMSADGEPLTLAALTAIHWTHRLGAVIASIALLALAWRLGHRHDTQAAGIALFASLSLQVGIGIANVLLSLPLPLAVAHNAGAAVLVGVMVWINFSLRAAPAAALAQPGGRPHGRHENAYI